MAKSVSNAAGSRDSRPTNFVAVGQRSERSSVTRRRLAESRSVASAGIRYRLARGVPGNMNRELRESARTPADEIPPATNLHQPAARHSVDRILQQGVRRRFPIPSSRRRALRWPGGAGGCGRCPVVAGRELSKGVPVDSVGPRPTSLPIRTEPRRAGRSRWGEWQGCRRQSCAARSIAAGARAHRRAMPGRPGPACSMPRPARGRPGKVPIHEESGSWRT